MPDFNVEEFMEDGYTTCNADADIIEGLRFFHNPTFWGEFIYRKEEVNTTEVTVEDLKKAIDDINKAIRDFNIPECHTYLYSSAYYMYDAYIPKHVYYIYNG